MAPGVTLTLRDVTITRGDRIVVDRLSFGAERGELLALMGRLSLFVTNDSGPMHIAAAVGTPVVALFGPTHPERCGPYGTEHRVLRASCRCASLRRSPRFCQEAPSCLEALSVGTVAEASLQALKEGGSGRAAPSTSFWKEDTRPAREETWWTRRGAE